MNEESFIESFVDEFKSAMRTLEEVSPSSADMIMKTDYANYVRSKMERMIDPPRLATAAEICDAAVKRLSETKHPPIDPHAIQRVHYLLRQHHLDPRTLSLVIPEADFLTFFAGWFSDRVKAEDLGSSIRFCNIEILRGVDTVIVWLSIPVIHPDRDALEAEILRCLGRGAIRELPQGASSNGVSPSVKPSGEVGVTSGAASGDNRNPNGLAHLSNEAKVIAAKAAIAAYGREKKLPSAEALALFGELDRAKASRGAAAVDDDVRAARVKKLSRTVAYLLSPAHIKRHAHRLSSEALSRAADQAWVTNSGGAYRDLVSAAPQRLAEMVYRGDSAPNGKRGE